MKLLRIVSVLGFLISLYLLYAYTIAKKVVCIGGGCDIVASSPYSSFFGIPHPLLGMLFYASVFLMSFRKNLKTFMYVLITVGAVYSLYLTFLEVFVIKAICVWCVASALCSWILFLSMFHEG